MVDFGDLSKAETAQMCLSWLEGMPGAYQDGTAACRWREGMEKRVYELVLEEMIEEDPSLLSNLPNQPNLSVVVDNTKGNV